MNQLQGCHGAHLVQTDMDPTGTAQHSTARHGTHLAVVAGGAEELVQHGLHVLPHIASLGQGGSIHHGKGRIHQLGQRLGQQRLAAACGGPDRAQGSDTASRCLVLVSRSASAAPALEAAGEAGLRPGHSKASRAMGGTLSHVRLHFQVSWCKTVGRWALAG